VRQSDWCILVGYPLEGEFHPEGFGVAVREILEEFRPREAWLIAPQLPREWEGRYTERESDHYFTLELPAPIPKPLGRAVTRARENLTVSRSAAFMDRHLELIGEFLERVNPHSLRHSPFWP
jgi:hypothetical protein